MKSQQALLKSVLFENDLQCLRGKFMPNALMKLHTTIRVGGPAAGMYIPDDLKDLKGFFLLCKKNRISLLPIGRGSNIIITDKGLKNIFLKLSSPYFTKISMEKNIINCGSGVTINKLCIFAEENSLSGAEFLTGIPATAGGAVFQNAGACSKDISCILKSIECLDPYGKVAAFEVKDIDFKYRYSGLRGYIILSARFCLKRSKRTIIRNNIKKILDYRLSAQDYTAPSAGCVFKNPNNAKISAGAMIDNCGLKGTRIGGAQISRKHANFIINKGNACAEDVLRLISIARKKVKSIYGVNLQTEVEII